MSFSTQDSHRSNSGPVDRSLSNNSLEHEQQDDFNMLPTATNSSSGFNNTTAFLNGNSPSLSNTRADFNSSSIVNGSNLNNRNSDQYEVDDFNYPNPTNRNLHNQFQGDDDESQNDRDLGCEENNDDDECDDDNLSEASEIMDERQFIRISTAPPRPLTDLEEFKRSYEFLLLEQAIVTFAKLIQKDYQKFDLDSPDGQKAFRKFLSIIERLIKAFDCKTTGREYRDKFSKAYKILYKEGELCYLTEILDSAQEGFPYLYVNGEKFTFTSEVLEAGQHLLNCFFKVQHILRNAYTRTCQENITVSSFAIKREIAQILEKFDAAWARFEKYYVTELMNIETEARRYVQSAINLEKDLSSIEIREKIKGRFFVQSGEYVRLRSKLCKCIADMNAVANVDGKGRDDLDFEVLSNAEGILRRITNEQSRAVRVLAEEIQTSFSSLRTLFRKYEANIEMVDPQLKNNHDLVEALNVYESTWEKGKNYFLDGKKCGYLIHLSHIIETTAKKHNAFQEQLDCRDADIFLSIPCLLILKLLDGDDKNICAYFLPQMFDSKNKLAPILHDLQADFAEYKSLRKTGYKYYNTLERVLLNVDVLSESEAAESILNSTRGLSLGRITHKIKQLAMEMQRNNPTEWNSFMDAAITSS